ncbi:MAG: hypothetical protein ACC663_06855, partial [Gammaproteobacteria bacterium]
CACPFLSIIEFKQPPKSPCIFRLSAIAGVGHILPLIHTPKKVCFESEITCVIERAEHERVKSLPCAPAALS